MFLVTQSFNYSLEEAKLWENYVDSTVVYAMLLRTRRAYSVP